MAVITIRDVPNGVLDELAARAAASGQSLQEYLRAQLIERTRRPGAALWVAGVRERAAAAGHDLTAECILEHRDTDRR